MQRRVQEDVDYAKAVQTMETFMTDVMIRYTAGRPASGTASACPHLNERARAQCREDLLIMSPIEAGSDRQAAREQSASLLQIIMSVDEAGKPRFSQRQRIDQLSTFMFAGHETTANTISWAIYELARHPEVQARLRSEVRALLSRTGKGDVGLDYGTLFQLPYLTKVINETLRLWPVVPSTH